MPYHVAFSADVENALFLRKFNVPFWALSHIFGKDAMYWYRMEQSLGRNSIIGTTIKDAGENGLKEGYGIFRDEALDVNPDYQPKSVNTDGWKATINAWKSLFSGISVIICFLHVFIKIRDRSSKKFKDLFDSVGDKIWNCYEAESKASFSQRVRRLCEWADAEKLPVVISKPIMKLKNNLSAYSKAYDLPGCHRTSNMVDRLMQRMDRHLFSTFYFHGSLQAAELSIRGWALIQNFAPCNPTTVERHDGRSYPAEWLNKSRYHENWLQNLLASASMGGFRYPPPKPL